MTEIGKFNELYRLSMKTISFYDVDTDKDGVISKEEYQSMLDKIKADSVELTTSTSSSGTADENDVIIYEQVQEMEAALDELKAQISIDFCGSNSQYIADIAFDLKDYLAEFKNTYSEDISTMASAFKEALSGKYEELKALYLGTETSQATNENNDLLQYIQTQACMLNADDISTNINISWNPQAELLSDNIIKSIKQNLKERMENYGLSFDKIETIFNNVYNYSVNNLPESAKITSENNNWPYNKNNTIDINAFVEFFNSNMTKALDEMNKSDKDFDLQNIDISYISDFNSKYFSTYYMRSGFIAPDILENLKPDIEKEAQKMCDSNGITYDSAKFNEILENAKTSDFDNVQEFLENFKTEYTAWVYEQTNTAENGNNDLLQDIQTQACMLNADDISTNINISWNPQAELLSDNIIKSIKQNLKERMENYGLSFDKIETIFNNVYNYSVNNLPESAKITSENNNWPYNKNNTIDINAFVEFFNSNMTKALDEMNKSDKDFDLQNIDISNISDFNSKYFSTYYMRNGFIAPDILENLKPDIEKEAQKMCDSNGITFDSAKFNEILENAKTSDFDNVQEFLENFKTEYTAWVNSKKTE